jgi:hypothetical protein
LEFAPEVEWGLTIELSGLPGLDCRAWPHHIRGGEVRPAAFKRPLQ